MHATSESSAQVPVCLGRPAADRAGARMSAACEGEPGLVSRPADPGGPCLILEDWALPNEEQSTKREMTGVRQHAADRNVRRD
jgi:hypothetical protein